MATQISSYTGTTVQTAASFQQMLGFMLSGITNGGNIVQTSDTGQMNATTATASTSTGTPTGYWIFHLTDTNQGASPIFFKLEVGTGQTANTHLGVWLTMGTGSDGAGNITGVTVTRLTAPMDVNTTGGFAIYFSTQPGFLVIQMRDGNNNYLAVGRLLNSTVGFTLFRSTANVSGADRLATTDGGWIYNPGNLLMGPSYMYPGRTTAVAGGLSVLTFYPFIVTGNQTLAQIPTLAMTGSSIGNQNQIVLSVNIDGTASNWLAVNNCTTTLIMNTSLDGYLLPWT